MASAFSLGRAKRNRPDERGIGPVIAELDDSSCNPVAHRCEVQLDCGFLVALTGLPQPGMVSRRHGGVINVASTARFNPRRWPIYGASEALRGALY